MTFPESITYHPDAHDFENISIILNHFCKREDADELGLDGALQFAVNRALEVAALVIVAQVAHSEPLSSERPATEGAV